ncbi:MAG: hypothetical protein IJH13_01300 [Bacilli bacterium]|nr:hypothetical protein [Bacilli bacterium]
MKKLLYVLILFSFLFINTVSVNAKEKVTIYFFHGRGCPHCAEEEKFLDNLKTKYDNIVIKDYEVWYNDENKKLMDKVKKELKTESSGVPFTVISDVGTIGYTDSIGRKLDRLVDFYSTEKSIDAVKLIEEGKYKPAEKNKFKEKEKEEDEATTFNFPFIGKVKARNLSLISATIAIGLVDGFNPCAMWVLIFLISILVTMKDRKKMWWLGGTFLLTSAICYFLILLFWSGITEALNGFNPLYLKLIIAVVALIGAVINIRAFIISDDSGCVVVDDKKRKPIIQKIKKYTTEKSFKAGIIGIALLALSVNLIELACSAGLPAMFTGLLGINDIAIPKSLWYIFVYTLAFMLDDVIIFIIAMKTMKVAAISSKYNKYSHLVGGLIMLIIGLLVIFKPEWLMFTFS